MLSQKQRQEFEASNAAMLAYGREVIRKSAWDDWSAQRQGALIIIASHFLRLAAEVREHESWEEYVKIWLKTDGPEEFRGRELLLRSLEIMYGLFDQERPPNNDRPQPPTKGVKRGSKRAV